MTEIRLPKMTGDGTSLTGNNHVPKKNRKLALSIKTLVFEKLPALLIEEGSTKEVWNKFSGLLTPEERAWLDLNPAWIRECIFDNPRFVSQTRNVLATAGLELLCTHISWEGGREAEIRGMSHDQLVKLVLDMESNKAGREMP